MSEADSIDKVSPLNDRQDERGVGRKVKAIGVFFIMFLSAFVMLGVSMYTENLEPETVDLGELITETLDDLETPGTNQENYLPFEEETPVVALEEESPIIALEEEHDIEVENYNPIPSALPASQTVFDYDPFSTSGLSLGTESGYIETSDSGIIIMGGNGPSNKSKGGKLGNAPEALYRVLEKFLAKGKAPPPNFPVPYTVYTLSDGGVEKVTDVLTKQPTMIDVDNSSDTGQGKKDIRVKTTIDTDPLVITTEVERLGNTNPTFLQVLVTFPAFFYNGEAGDPDGEPYWMFGYSTEIGSEIPEDITMTFGVDRTLGSEHIFNFDWTSDSGIDPLMFTMGIFQVQDQDTSSPIFPAFADFIVSSPPFAGLDFTTFETDDVTLKCMNWTAPSSFALDFGFSEAETILAVDFDYDMTVTVDSIPQSFSFCMEEDRATNEFTVDYTASSTVDIIEVMTEIVINDISTTVSIELGVEDMPAGLHAVLGDGYLNVDVDTNVGLVRLDATADIGLAGIDNMINLRLRINDIPDFGATWYEGGAGNGFALDAPSCVGSIELAFSYGAIMLPPEHAADPDSHYLSAWSDPGTTAIAVRVLGISHIGFDQDNNDASNSLTMTLCENNILYVLAHSEVGSLLTPNADMDLRIVMDETPTELTCIWTVPFTLTIATNDAIDSIIGDLTMESVGPPPMDLTAHAEILDIPANMTWVIDPAGSIAFTADSYIGTVELGASDPNGLQGTSGFFAGDPIRLLDITIHEIPSFTAAWATNEAGNVISVSFNAAPSMALGDLTFAITTSETNYVVLIGPEENKGMFYHDDEFNLGNGFVMEGSVWLHVEDITRVEIDWGGTIVIGIGVSVSHELHLAAQFDGTSTLNPEEPEPLTASVLTTPLPTSMDLEVDPSASFDYTASGEIDLVTIDATIGDPLADPWIIHIEIEGIPTHAEGVWEVGNPGSLDLILSDRLDRILVQTEDAGGIKGGNLVRVEVLVIDVPEGIEADWNTNNKEATLNMLDNTYSEGLGEFRLLATEGEETPTENYINSLGTVLACMTTYTDFTSDIDEGYWPWTVPSRLDSLYCRQPTLDTGADDYAVFRSGDDGANDFKLYAIRIRELGLLDLLLDEANGYVDVEFSRNVALARQLYIVSDDFDDDKITVAEVSALPDGLPTNSIHAEWNRGAGHYAYALSEEIPYIDAYLGDHDSTSLDSDYNKIVLKDVPASVTLDYDFQGQDGFAYFMASSPWEAGLLIQDGDKRYVAWLQLQSLFFNYSYALPGDESCSHGYKWEWCYRVFRLETDLVAAPVNADGILGIYGLKSGLEALITPAPTAPGAEEYIPQWTFILDEFEIMEIDILWDIFIGVDPLDLWDDVGFNVGANVFPVIYVQFGFNIAVDYFWNSNIDKTIFEDIPLPLPPPFGGIWTVKIKVNEVKDYRDQNPLHVFPLGDFPVTVDTGDSDWYFAVLWVIKIVVKIDVPGFHRFDDHPTPFT
jgi:hypothetical protein